jgi:peptidyl-tRNA hydrolase, PTH1 family
MKLLVGLGNPGNEYVGTRHNVGFEVIAKLLDQWNLGRTKPKLRFQSNCTELVVEGDKWILMSPLTYMNRSGTSVQQAVKFFQIATSDLLVICDDLSLPLGRVRIREQGSAGGQKGLKNICDCLGTQAVPRLRLGIDPVPPEWDAADYVLAQFSREERPVVANGIERAASAAACWARQGITAAMNQFNSAESTK